MAFADPIPQFLHMFDYNSPTSNTTTSPPPILVNSTEPATQSQFGGPYVENGYITNENYPYTIWVTTGFINGQKYIDLIWRADSSACCSGPTGNTTLAMTLYPNGTDVDILGMSVTFTPFSGSGLNLADTFNENYGALLYQAMGDLGPQIFGLGIAYTESMNQSIVSLGEADEVASFAVDAFSLYLQNSINCPSCLTSGIANVEVPHFLSITGLSFNLTPECALSATIATGVEFLLTLVDVPEGLEAAMSAIHALAGIYDVVDLSTECISATLG